MSNEEAKESPLIDEQQKKLSQLPPNDSVKYLAAFTFGSASAFTATCKWKNADGTDGKKITPIVFGQ